MQRLLRQALRDWPAAMISALLLAGGLFALALPVMLNDYDRYGVQIECGNGYVGRSVDAALADGQPTAEQAGRCRSAVAHRRAVAIPAAGLGAALLIPGLVKWWRTRPETVDPGETWSEAAHPDEAMHDAAVLDRRAHLPWQDPPKL